MNKDTEPRNISNDKIQETDMSSTRVIPISSQEPKKSGFWKKLGYGAALITTVVTGGVATVAIVEAIQDHNDQSKIINDLNTFINTREANIGDMQTKIAMLQITPLPTETLIPSATPISTEALKATETSTKEPPTITIIPSPIPATNTLVPTATLDKKGKRTEVMGENELTNWDADSALKINMNGNSFYDWIAAEDVLFAEGVITEGDIRTYDKIRELKQGVQFSYVKANGSFPKADEVVDEAKGIGNVVYGFLGYQNVDSDIAKALGLQIIDMTVNRRADNKSYDSKNSYPLANQGVGVKRSQEPELHICTDYTGTVKISEETVRGGILHESNEALWVFDFNISEGGLKSKYPELKVLTINDINGVAKKVSWRAFDFGSEPNVEAKMKAPDDFKEKVWGSEITKPCGVEIKPTIAAAVIATLNTPVGVSTLTLTPQITPESTPIIPDATPDQQPSQTPGKQPTVTKVPTTPKPPTNVPPTQTPVGPTSMPTNQDNFPSNTPQLPPTQDIKPTRAG